MNYLVFKSLHIIAVVTWFAGLFYMPRLFVYYAEANEKAEIEKNTLQNQFKIMQRRLWFGITWPSALAVLLLGSSLIPNFWPITHHPWLISKLVFVVGLYGYQFFLHDIYKKQQTDRPTYSPMALRIINEISTIFLVAIVFLVVLKDVLSMLYGLIGLILFVALLLISIKIYKKLRVNQ